VWHHKARAWKQLLELLHDTILRLRHVHDSYEDDRYLSKAA